MPPFLFIRLRPSWGYALRMQPQSKMRAAIKYPPPTSVLGAIAYPFLHLNNERSEVVSNGREFMSSIQIMRNFVDHVSISLIGEISVYGSYLKINQIYRGEVLSGVTAFPFVLTYSSDDSFLDILYILKDGLKEDIFEKLERAAWGIVRVGSRESIFSSELVEIGDAVIRENESAKTRFSFEYMDKYEIDGDGTILSLVDWKSNIRGSYPELPHKLIFYPKGSVKVRTAEGKLRIFKVSGKAVEDEVIF